MDESTTVPDTQPTPSLEGQAPTESTLAPEEVTPPVSETQTSTEPEAINEPEASNPVENEVREVVQPTPADTAETPLPITEEVLPPLQPAEQPSLSLEQMLARLSPTELKALFKKYLLEIGAKGRAKSKAQLAEKQQKIIAHLGIHGRITHKEVMTLTHSAKTTATRILQSLEKEGKVVQHGGYKAHDAYYSLRL